MTESFLPGCFRFPEGAGVKQVRGRSAGSPVSGVKRGAAYDIRRAEREADLKRQKRQAENQMVYDMMFPPFVVVEKSLSRAREKSGPENGGRKAAKKVGKK